MVLDCNINYWYWKPPPIGASAMSIHDDPYTEEEKNMVAKMVWAEAVGEDLKGKELVVSVILNRVDSKKFPDTIEEVLYQPYQFTSIKNGRYASAAPDEECYRAVENVMDGYFDYKEFSDGALYFTSGRGFSGLRYLFKHQHHSFYR